MGCRKGSQPGMVRMRCEVLSASNHPLKMKFRLSRKLTLAEKAQLENCKALLTKPLAELGRRERTLKTNLENQKRLQAKETMLDAEAETGGEDASMRLFAVKDQLRRVEIAIRNSKYSVLDGQHAVLKELAAVQGVLAVICQADFVEQIHEAARRVASQFFADADAGARKIVWDSDVQVAVANRFKLPFSYQEFPEMSAELARDQISIIEKLMAGEVIVEFEGDGKNMQPR